MLKKYNANLIGFACIIDRSDDKLLIKDKITSQVKIEILTYKENELPEEIKNIEPIKPGSRNII